MALPTFKELENAITLSGDLEADLSGNAGFLFHVGMGAARADSEVDDQKYALLCKEAVLQEEVRNAAATANEKVTEALVTSRVKASDAYEVVYRELLRLQRVAREWEALLNAFESRGRSLYNLSMLATKHGVDSSGIANRDNYDQLRNKAAAQRAHARTPLRPT